MLFLFFSSLKEGIKSRERERSKIYFFFECLLLYYIFTRMIRLLFFKDLPFTFCERNNLEETDWPLFIESFVPKKKNANIFNVIYISRTMKKIAKRDIGILPSIEQKQDSYGNRINYGFLANSEQSRKKDVNDCLKLVDTRRDETLERLDNQPGSRPPRFLGVAGSRAGPRRFVKSAKSWVEGSFYRDRTDHPSPEVTCTVEGSLSRREVMGGLGARFA